MEDTGMKRDSGSDHPSQPHGLVQRVRQRALQGVGDTVARGVISSAERVTRAINSTPDGSRTFFDVKDFAFARRLEHNWHLIRRELDDLMRGVDLIPNLQDISHEQRDVTTDDRWKMFVLYAYGLKVENNCRRCPQTTRLVEGIPGMKSAMFSILRGGKHLPAHYGHYNGVLRYHLGLIVPEPDKCRIRVGQDMGSWAEGSSLIFDDTHDHEVWNDSDKDRVVLFVDFLRPLPPVLDGLNRMVVKMIGLSPYIRKGEENMKRWEEYFGQELDLRRSSGKQS